MDENGRNGKGDANNGEADDDTVSMDSKKDDDVENADNSERENGGSEVKVQAVFFLIKVAFWVLVSA